MENDRLNEIRELNPDYDISMHELDVCVGDNQYRLMYYVYVQHKESGIGVYGDKDFDMQEVINRLPIKFTIEKEHSIIPKGVHIKICDFSSSRGVFLFSDVDNYFKNHTVSVTINYPLKNPYTFTVKCIVLNIKDHYETFAVIPRGKSKLQVYMTISNGTNGAEGCIINSMEDVLNVLKNLRKYKGVNWSQLLEVGIDNADDLYWWYVTFSIDTTAI